MFFISCNQDDEIISKETVQVSFSAALPQVFGARATTSGLTVDKVVCAVFENDVEISNLRETISIVDGQGIHFTPRLIKGRSYDVVFWASKEGCYNTQDLTRITRTTPVPTGMAEQDFDAFTESVNIQVTGSDTKSVTLKRPFAQLNIGVTQEDWNAVVNNFNLMPSTMVVTIEGKNTFNALTGVAVGEETPITYNLACSGDDLSVNSTTYKSIASCYVLPDAQKENFDITYTINDQNTTAIRNDIFYSVPLQANYKTNVVGGLLTGVITYDITIQQAFETTENNKNMQ